MPIGIVNKSDFEKEVSRNTNNQTITAQIEIDKAKGRGDKKETPEPIRALISQEALLGISHKELAKEFNVSPASVSAYKNGATSTASYNEGDKQLKNKNNIFRDRIVKRAGRLAVSALDSISPDDFDSASLVEKATVAKQMASIVKDMTPQDTDIDTNMNVQVIVHAPQMRTEQDYTEGIVSVE